MTNPRDEREEILFLTAAALEESARDEFLVRECADDVELRARVKALLLAAEGSEKYFDSLSARLGGAQFFASTPEVSDVVATGERVGPYTLIERIGSGGMGSVWRAQRSDGRFEAQVAIKFLRIQEGAAAARRFQLEGGYLARLTHPNIARLLDAGISERGLPYLVLELVDGLAIDAYAERHGLSVEARVRLFLHVLDAVQHAHAHLIIHRDIKPSNVLVTARGEVKLLDFGVAKLLSGDAGTEPGVTRELGVALTPEYAAPEQYLDQPVTTATDVYSLGLLLYRLLSGRHARENLGNGAQALLKLATAPDPGPPSAVSMEEPARRALRGDLDNIVGKATAREAGRRYASVAELAADLRRHLEHEPVTAQPPTVTYRIGKFVRRHRGGVAAATLMGVLLISATAMTAWQARVAQAGERRANDVKDFVASIFRGVDPNALGVARPRTAVEILDQAAHRVDTELAHQPRVQEELRVLIGRSYLGLYEAERALPVLKAAQEKLTDETPAQMRRETDLAVADALQFLSRFDEAQHELSRVYASLGPDPRSVDFVRAKLTESAIHYQRGSYDPAAESAKEALDAAGKVRDLDPALRAQVHTTYAKAVQMQRRLEESLVHNQEAFRLALAAYHQDHDHPQVLEMEHNYASSLIGSGRIPEALPHLERSLTAARNTYGDQSLIASRYAVRLGLARMERGELRPAIELIDFGTRIESELNTGISPATSGRLRTLGRVHLAVREPAPARDAFARAMDVMRRFDARFMLLVLEADHAFAGAAHDGAIGPAIIELDRVIGEQDRGDARYKSHLPDLYAAQLLLWNREPDRAAPYLQRGLELARKQTRITDLAEALVLQGNLLLEKGDVAGAEAAFREARELLEKNQVMPTPPLADARLGLGRAAAIRGDVPAALEELTRAHLFWKEFSPQNRYAGEAAFWLGEVLRAAGRDAEAAEAYTHAVRALAGSRLRVDQEHLRLARTRANHL